MNNSQEQTPSSKFLENSLLLATGLLAHAPLYYQLPRWSYGLDPTFVRPGWIERTSFPFAAHLLDIHPIMWVCVMIFAFAKLCRNYGWKLEASLRE